MPAPALLSPRTLNAYEHAVDVATELVTTAAQSATAPVNPEPAEHLRRRVRAVDLDAPLGSLEDALLESRGLYLDHAVWFHNPRYMAHLNCPVALPAIAADVVATSVNTAVETWDQSLGATHIEQHLINWTANRLGLGELADGVFTSGGTASNLQGLLMARGQARAAGYSDSELCVLATDESHFSVVTAAQVLGLGPESVVCVDTDFRGRMSADALRHTLNVLALEGRVPMAVAATAGTTDRGVFDPIAELAAVCSLHDVWLHVDAAVGAGLITSSRHRHLLNGVGCADSVTVDFHKTWYQPVAASAILVRDRSVLRHVRFHTEYLNPSASQVPNLADKSMQTTRRFDAFKPWLTLRTLGADTIGEWLDASMELTQVAYDVAREIPAIEVLERPTSFMLLFRFVDELPDDELNALNDAIRVELFAGGETVIARTRHEGQTWLKLTLLNPNAQLSDLHAAFEDVVACGRRLTTGARQEAMA